MLFRIKARVTTGIENMQCFLFIFCFYHRGERKWLTQIKSEVVTWLIWLALWLTCKLVTWLQLLDLKMRESGASQCQMGMIFSLLISTMWNVGHIWQRNRLLLILNQFVGYSVKAWDYSHCLKIFWHVLSSTGMVRWWRVQTIRLQAYAHP